MRVLITGASGFIGARLGQALAATWQVTGTYRTGQAAVPPGVAAHALDVRDAGAVAALFAAVRPDAVVHAAGMASMADCAQRPDDADACNREGTRLVARCARQAGARMVTLSTDLVFDGRTGRYAEADVPQPLCAYGRSKRAGEVAAQDEHPDVCILRLALTYGWSSGTRPCFLETMLTSLGRGEQVRLFVDEYRTPVFIDDLCRAIPAVLAAGVTGTYHVAGPRRLSRYDLGRLAARAFALPTDSLVPVARATVDATRPADCSLVASPRLAALGCVFGDPAEALAAMATRRSANPTSCA